MRTITAVNSITRAREGVVVKAPHLSRLVDVLFRLREQPDDKRARIQAALLSKGGVDVCVACSAALTLEGFSETRTEFVERRALACRCCGTAYVLSERQIS